MKQNPFKPTAGRTPPELIGREDILLEFTEGLDNGPGAPGRLMRLTGMRGMGKTAVLNELGSLAGHRGWTVIDETSTGSVSQRILQRLSPRTSIRGTTLQPEVLGVSLGAIEFERTSIELRTAMEKAAKKGLLITLDEVQDSDSADIATLASTVQHLIREDLDIAFVFAGLPSLVEGVVNSKASTFLRRAVPFNLGSLSTAEIADSFETTIADSGFHADRQIAETMAEAAQGYPFMVQLVGYYSWQAAARQAKESIGNEEIERGVRTARLRFDETVIEPALHGLPAEQMRFLIAMAQTNTSPCKTAEVAKLMGKTASQISMHRARLISAGIIDAGSWGRLHFAIPFMNEYIADHEDALVSEIEG
ncbi:AAA family ATPase [Curtanaerobium respiraculi]|uniref:AAA family ATPase n=1 Tax=Curtanaerobium respiraculi TaxID=2949669 RepID=UPI0024B3535B|nr:ATP-binding protein [Curtanaerobium respiraculi]